MEFHAAAPLVLTNARVVAAERVFPGWIATDRGRIVEIGDGRGPKDGIDCQGDYLLPGLVELHTDHLEAHFMPRPRVLARRQRSDGL
jgi:alpha-D-ribose 1-methylphosphonate 5-triphosphate diphosphatase